MSRRSRHRGLELVAAVIALAAVLAIALGVILLALGHPPTPRQRTVLELSLIGFAIAAFGYTGLRTRLAAVLWRLVEHDRLDPHDVLRGFAGPFSRAVPLDEALLTLLESLRDSMLLSRAEVWTVDGEQLTLRMCDPGRPDGEMLALGAEVVATLAAGEVRGEAWARLWSPSLLERRTAGPLAIAPVVHAGQLLGILVAARAAETSPLAESDEEVLGALARELALVLHNLRLDSALQASYAALQRGAQELRDSRARIVATADAERRRIERDLHDGAQQRLLALSMRLAEARDGPAAHREAALVQASDDLRAALAELRALAQGIYPPLLTASGLPAALTAVARAAAIPVHTELDTSRRYPPAAEAAVYFCCMEALNNVARHAGPGATASVRVTESEDRLNFTVTDDGREPHRGDGGDDRRDATAPGGTGLVSIRDRIGAVGGRVETGPLPHGGWRVAGSVPVPAPGSGLSGGRPPGTAAPPSPGG